MTEGAVASNPELCVLYHVWYMYQQDGGIACQQKSQTEGTYCQLNDELAMMS